jgi:hypothetical protein
LAGQINDGFLKNLKNRIVNEPADYGSGKYETRRDKEPVSKFFEVAPEAHFPFGVALSQHFNRREN